MELPRNLVPISEILITDDEGRIREEANLIKAVSEKTRSLLRFGQMQPILVESLEGVDGKKWKLVDGQVRLVSMLALTARATMKEEEVVKAFDDWNMKPGYIEVTTRETLDPTTALMMEFHANEDRDNFNWDEKARYIRRIHDMLQEKHGRKEWGVTETAEAIGQSPATVSHYLQLTDEQNPATKSEKVKKATTKGAAIKQLKIENRRQVAKARAKSRESGPQKDVRTDSKLPSLIAYNGDCRNWIKKIPDNSLDWFHWDPPWGGDEGAGGAFAAHEAIQTSHEYALELQLQMLPEIWRVLHDGGWLVMWFTPVHYDWLRLALQGHRFSSEDGCCHFCEKHIVRDHIWLATNYSCRRSPFRFWTNPYPNIWRKPDRKADGHEIQRFLTKETEMFLLAGKQDEINPILMRSDRGNVFDFNSILSEDRRHVNHKPWGLLAEILSLISVPGGLGGDASSGSGSILEGAYNSHRKVIVSEIDPDYHATNLAVAADVLKNKNYNANSIAPWLEEAFGKE